MIIAGDCDFIAENAPCDWQKLKGAKLFLTGGTGFFGKWFLHSFCHINKKLRLDARMEILTRDPEKFLHSWPVFRQESSLSFLKGDVRDFHLHDSCDFLIHAATPSDGRLDESLPDELFSIIAEGTRNVVKNTEAAGVKKMLYVSSGGVYGTQPPELPHMPETFAPHPSNAYGRGKLEAEKLCFAGSVPSSSARCFALVGPYQNLNAGRFAITSFISDAINSRPISVRDGRPYRSYLYAADLMIWLWTILLEGKDKETYNVGSEEAVSIMELAQAVAKCVVPPAVVHAADAVYSARALPPRYVPDTRKAAETLKLRQLVPFADGIKKTVEWSRRNCLNVH
ncbi:MAG: NAD(P)-dependent oxidoreductase [Synergistes sp.]|nr:NAD(P)-dependent oxidoreductase [Synergistes sp.]